MKSPDLSNAVDYHYGAFPPETLDYERLVDPLLQTTTSITRYDQMLRAMQNSEILLAPLRRQEAVVSSRMEGTISTLDEILRVEAEAESGDEEAFFRARGEAVETLLYSRAMHRIQDQMKEGHPLSEWLIRSAHQMLLSFGRGAAKNPGSYKDEQNYIGDERRKTVSFVPISPDRLQSGMEQLIEFSRAEKPAPLLKTALAHIEFEALHPFKDGNGRVGRMLITLMLWDYDLIREPHFYVSAYLEEMREEYIERMRRVSSHGEWTEWCQFFLEALDKQACRNIDTAQRVFDLYEDMKERFRETLNSPWAMNAVDFMFANPVFRNNRFTRHSDIPSHVAMRITRELRKANLITEVVPSAGQRPAMYSFEPLLEIVRDEPGF